MPPVTVEQSGAFVQSFAIPPIADGPLAGLRFAVKDIIDVAGHRTGCGNPTWLATHSAATLSAVCVEQLLAAGAECVGKTVTDEFAFSLIGENHFYGTPLNPAAPERVPGGSSSGSASAVACELVDFALGTDTGGSVRVPASNCGVWGFRPTHGSVSVAGVMPFAPTYDTVGIIASNINVMQRAATVLLSEGRQAERAPGTIYLITEAFELVEPAVRDALKPAVSVLERSYGASVRATSLGDLCRDSDARDLSTWLDTYRVLMGVEVDDSLGAWIAEVRPKLGPAAATGFEFIERLDRTRAADFIQRREHYASQLRRAMGPGDLLCLPTVPMVAPRKGTGAHARSSDYYQRTLSLTSIAGVAGLPQISMPLASTSAAPVGLSLIGRPDEDLFVLKMASPFAAHLPRDQRIALR